MFCVFCTLSNETIAYFSNKEKAETFVKELSELTKDIQMIGRSILLKPFGEFLILIPTELDIKNAQDVFNDINESIKQANDDFVNNDYDNDEY